MIKNLIYLTLFSLLSSFIKSQDEIVEDLSLTTNSLEQVSSTVLKPNVKDPEIYFVNPTRREGTAHTHANIAPCGGIIKGKADTLTNIGSEINGIWEVRHPTGSGNCTVSISPALDQNFTSLRPVGSEVEYDDNFSFACGRQHGFEFQQFNLPENYASDSSTLQFKWETPQGTYYTYSDIMIIGAKSKFLNDNLNFLYIIFISV
jgi:hypothetical protein